MKLGKVRPAEVGRQGRRLGGILTKPRTNLASSSMQFPAIDIDGMIKRMRLKDKAHEQGTRNLPDFESRGFDAVEQEIVNEIENEAKIQYNDYLASQQAYADRAGNVAIQNLPVKLGTTASDAITDFQRETHVGTDDLYARKREVIETEAELKRFRAEHGIKRPARNYGKRVIKIGFLLVILVIEAVLNGTFLAKGSVFGLVGGVFEALIIAAINVVVGWAVGRGVAPWLSYRHWGVRILSAIGVLAYLALAVGFNLAVAHYRTAVAGEPFEASLLAYRSLVADPLAIEDLQSWALFVVGFIFSIAAAIDGWLMDDPYPGYGQRMRQNLEALEDYNTLKDQLLDDLEEIKKRAETAMDEIAQTVQDRQNEFGVIVLRSHALLANMEQHFAHLESAANTLLRFYRDENRRHRTTPAPARFDEPWVYHRPSLSDETVVIGSREKIDETVRQVLEEIPRQRVLLHDAYRTSLDKYKEIDRLVSENASR